MRHVNKELKKYDARLLSIEQNNQLGMKEILKSNYPFVYCPECGSKIINDYGMISQHMRNKHIRERSLNVDKGHRFHPIPKE